jgi:hypothetical protein
MSLKCDFWRKISLYPWRKALWGPGVAVFLEGYELEYGHCGDKVGIGASGGFIAF